MRGTLGQTRSQGHGGRVRDTSIKIRLLYSCALYHNIQADLRGVCLECKDALR